MGTNGHSPSSAAKTSSPRGGAGAGGGVVEHYSPSTTKSPRAGVGIGGMSMSSLLPSGGVPSSLVESRWTLSAAVTAFLFIVAVLTVTSTSSSSSLSPASFFSFFPASNLVETHVQQKAESNNASSAPPPPPPGAGVPRLAYLVSGSKGDLDRLWRALHALYHPRNLYVVHLDREAPVGERMELARRVANSTVFRRVGNVEVIRRANMVTYRGPTMVANTLHACAVLLRRSRDWDWFINLSASDYPLMTQDGTLACAYPLQFLHIHTAD